MVNSVQWSLSIPDTREPFNQVSRLTGCPQRIITHTFKVSLIKGCPPFQGVGLHFNTGMSVPFQGVGLHFNTGMSVPFQGVGLHFNTSVSAISGG